MFQNTKIRKTAIQKLMRGISKSQVLEELRTEFPDNPAVETILRFIPTRDSKERFGKFNSFLFLALIVFLLFDIAFLDFFSIPLIIVDLYLIWIVGSFRLRWYPLIFFRALTTMGIMGLFWLGFSIKNPISFYTTTLLLSLLAFGYGFFVARKLAGNGNRNE